MALQFAEMIVGKNAQGRSAQFRAVDQRRVTQFVENDDVVFIDQRRNCSERCHVTAAETERRFRFLPFRERGFEAKVRRLRPARSEEHTSELQSRGQLVCRLLRETTKSG